MLYLEYEHILCFFLCTGFGNDLMLGSGSPGGGGARPMMSSHASGYPNLSSGVPSQSPYPLPIPQ